MRRAIATDKEVLNQYFDILENTLKKNHIFNNPARIFICDETGLPLNPKSAKVACSHGSKTVSCVTGEGKAQITVLACTCATGTPLPPFVIYDRKTLNAGLTTGEVPGIQAPLYEVLAIFYPFLEVNHGILHYQLRRRAHW